MNYLYRCVFFFFSSRRRHTRLQGDWSSDVCSSDLKPLASCDHTEIDIRSERLVARMDGQDRLPAGQVRGPDEHLPVEASRAEQRGVEVLQPVRRAHDHDLVARAEAVELDEQLVEGLVLLACEALAGSCGTDSVELVDEDDRRSVASRLIEQLPHPRRAETDEHLDERGGALRVELRTRLSRDALGE